MKISPFKENLIEWISYLTSRSHEKRRICKLPSCVPRSNSHRPWLCHSDSGDRIPDTSGRFVCCSQQSTGPLTHFGCQHISNTVDACCCCPPQLQENHVRRLLTSVARTAGHELLIEFQKETPVSILLCFLGRNNPYLINYPPTAEMKIIAAKKHTKSKRSMLDFHYKFCLKNSIFT